MCIKFIKYMDCQNRQIFESTMVKGNTHIQRATPALNIEPHRLESKKKKKK